MTEEFKYANMILSGGKDLTPKGVNTMEVMEMTEKEQIAVLIDQFVDLQRIKAASDKEKEIDYQIRTTKAKLEAMGIVTEDLNI